MKLLKNMNLHLAMYLAFLIASNVLVIRNLIAPLHILLIAWSYFLLYMYRRDIYSLFRTMPFKFILVYLLLIFVSIVANLSDGYIVGLKTFLLTAIPMVLVVFIGSKISNIREFYRILIPSLVVQTLFSVISIGMFFLGIGGKLKINGSLEYFGVTSDVLNKTDVVTLLHGVYYDANHAALLAVLAMGFGVLLLYRCLKLKVKIGYIVMVTLLILSNLLFLSLANSRGALLSIVVAYVLVFILYILHLVSRKIRKRFNYKFVLLAIIMLPLFFYIDASIKTVVYTNVNVFNIQEREYIYSQPFGFKQKSTHTPSRVISNISKVDSKKKDEAPSEETESTSVPLLYKQDWGGRYAGTGNGRTLIWEDAFKIFANRPFTGISVGNTSVNAERYDVKYEFLKNNKELHNSYLDVLVYYGIFAFIALGFSIWYMLIRIIFRKSIIGIPEYFIMLFMVLFIMSSAFFLSVIFVGITYAFMIFMLLISFLFQKSQDRLRV